MKYLYMILRLFFRPKCRHRSIEYRRNTVGKAKTADDIGYIVELKCIKCGDIKIVKVMV